jgi:hypothetical protein
MYGLADATLTPMQGAAPPATVSQYAAPTCGWGQKMVGSGPFTCQFDIGLALGEAWQVPGMYLGMIPGLSAVSGNVLSALFYGGVAYLMLGRNERRGR